MLSLSEDTQYEFIKAFNSTSKYQDDLLNVDTHSFDSMVNHIYPSGPSCPKHCSLASPIRGQHVQCLTTK